jgi:peptidoglycan/LPS O-acetylase OafA/YrhL
VSGSPEVDARPIDSGTASVDQGPAAGARVAQAGEARSARIESLRALAALSVLGAHAFLYSYVSATITDSYAHRVLLEGGFGGVDFFFVLSGYLLFWPFARSSFATGETVDLRRYALNRALRILPLYYVVVAVLLVLQHHGGTPGQWWRFGLFAENFSSSTLYTLDSPMWSLAVEVQFYVLLPFIALLIARLARGSRWAAISILTVAAIASFALRQVVFWHAKPPDTVLQNSIPTLFSFFAVGMVLALVRVAWLEQPPGWLRGVAGSSDAWILCAVPLWALVSWRYSYEAAAALASALIIGACVLPLRRGVFVRVTESRALSRLGLASYSIYLWHVPILLAIVNGSLTSSGFTGAVPTTAHFLKLLVVGGIVSCLFALISYRVIEAPALRLRRRWARSSAPPVAAAPSK